MWCSTGMCFPLFLMLSLSYLLPVIITSSWFKVGSHEGTCCRDMSRGRILRAVHTKGHVARIGFLKCSHGGSCRRDMSWFRFLIGLFSEVSRGHVAWTVHTRRPIFHENRAFTRWGTLSPRHVPAMCPLVWADLYGIPAIPPLESCSF